MGNMTLFYCIFHRWVKKAILMGTAVFFLFAASGCYLFPEEEKVLAPPLVKPSQITYETMPVSRDNLEKVVVERGTFISINQSDLSFKDNGGRIAAINVKMGDEVKKGDVLVELENGDLDKQITKQKLYYRKSQLTYEQMQNNGANRYDLEKMAIDLELSQIDLDSLLKQREESRLAADMDGKVVYVEKLNEGDYVNTFKTIVRIADPKQMQLEYTGDDAKLFKMGMKVEVKFLDEVFEGEVVMTPDTVPQDGDPKLKNSIRINVKDLSDNIRVGALANITLVLDKRDNALALPKALVHEYSGRNFVYILEDGLKKERDVELGLETATQVEIVKGLEEGELVITR